MPTLPSSKPALAIAYAVVACSSIVVAFWEQDWRYRMPTPVPAGLEQAAPGAPLGERVLQLTGLARSSEPRPLFLHFFNPACPCSRFNVDHLRLLVRKHSEAVRFVAVLQGDEDVDELRAEWDQLDLGVEAVVDVDGRIADACGVYSTPQAVLLDASGALYFRGNYNSTRYCDFGPTQYARLALEALRAGKPAFEPAPEATVAYGCPLPSDEGQSETLADAANGAPR